mmetsp:Transcript_6147/g.23918  ORF Transcript_6147/g.23918 Transcript_6147/m.23918 type:complete len:300 (+) Transcript_6147:230-1129(+)
MDLKTGGKLNLQGKPLLPATASVLRSVYAGFSTNFSLKVPYMAGLFACMQANKHMIGMAEKVSGREISPGTAQMISAALTGIEVSLFLGPLEMVRIQGQNCGKGGIVDATRAVYNSAPTPRTMFGAVNAFSRGLNATTHRELKYCLGQFVLCGAIADQMAKVMGGNPDKDWAPKIAGACIGGIACTLVSHPDDVIKTRMQTHLRGDSHFSAYSSYLSTGMHIVKNEGVHALFYGSIARCFIRVPLGLSIITLSSPMIRSTLEPLFVSSSPEAQKEPFKQPQPQVPTRPQPLLIVGLNEN